jgi:hypothetical protein
LLEAQQVNGIKSCQIGKMPMESLPAPPFYTLKIEFIRCFKKIFQQTIIITIIYSLFFEQYATYVSYPKSSESIFNRIFQ